MVTEENIEINGPVGKVLPAVIVATILPIVKPYTAEGCYYPIKDF